MFCYLFARFFYVFLMGTLNRDWSKDVLTVLALTGGTIKYGKAPAGQLERQLAQALNRKP